MRLLLAILLTTAIVASAIAQQDKSCEDARDDALSQYGQAINLAAQLNKELRSIKVERDALKKQIGDLQLKHEEKK